MAKTELFILNTKTIDTDLYLFFRYKTYDDNNALTESGIKYRKYEDGMEVSDNGVYLDTVGFYTLDQDSNKVYQEGSVYTLCPYFYDRTKNNFTLTLKKVGVDPETVDVEWTDFDKDGKYTYDDDDITVNLDLGNRIVNWTPKNGDKGVIGISIGIDALYFINEDMTQQQMLNHQFENITQKQGLVLEDNTNTIISDISTDYNNIINQMNQNTTDIITNDDTNRDDIKAKVEADKIEIENYIDNFVTEFTTLNGSDGAYLKDGTQIKLTNFQDIIWTIENSFHYTNDRGIVKVAYKIYSTYLDENDNEVQRHMIIDQNLVSEVVAS